MSNRPHYNRDYKNLPSQEAQIAYALSNKYWAMIATSVILLGSAMFLFSLNAASPNLQMSADQSATLSLEPAVNSAFSSALSPEKDSSTLATLSVPLPLPHYDENTSDVSLNEYGESSKRWRSVKVRNGDNLALIFARMDLSPQLLHNLLSSSTKAKKLKHLIPGQNIKFLFNENKFVSLIHEISKTKSLRIDKKGEDFISAVIERAPEVRVTHATGTIKSSLFLTAQNAGLPDILIMELADIFGWDIDFALDIRKGDSFIVAYEELYLDGEKISDGNIVAAEFINEQKFYRAVKYTSPDNKSGYFTPEGRNMRKAFLRTPVDFTRISSRFGKRRHPVLNRMRVHKGVDYAAPTGTPIRTTGDGKILFKGKKGGYGKTIIVQHGSGKQTLYAHMSSYKRGIQRGSRVTQGQIIGFVGSTGRTTGPHLHYEFRINGVHRNPLKLKFASANPVSEKFIGDFNYKTSGYIELLDVLGSTNVALR
ncbi:MAG: peptidoglycan DD-metalloendopeptidase family protein [Gammaproteobacteria bacterium]|nr:peptidoglycan DD-metalloendopeptidase family protein [Gammaproteobacteria bacterium]